MLRYTCLFEINLLLTHVGRCDQPINYSFLPFDKTTAGCQADHATKALRYSKLYPLISFLFFYLPGVGRDLGSGVGGNFKASRARPSLGQREPR